MALGCVVDLDQNGSRVSTRLSKVVIRSHARLTYEQVQDMLDDKEDVPEWFKEPLSALNKAATKLREYRVNAGTIVLRSHETKFGFDDQGELSEVLEVNRVWSHQIIEDACCVQIWLLVS